MPETVEKERLTKGFKEFMGVYKQVNVVKRLLKQRLEQQQAGMSQTQQLLEQLEMRSRDLLNRAPEPTDQLQEQKETVG